MSVYVDTSAFYAVVDLTDENHATAVSVWQDLIRRGETLLTSSYVMIETISLLHKRLGTEVVRRFIDDNLPVVQIHPLSQAQHDAALGAMLAIPGKSGPSLTDCASLEVMRHLKVRSIFAYDRHFVELGLAILG